MLQVKDPQEVFDEIIKPEFEQSAKEQGFELTEEMFNSPYSIFVLGEMYGTVSTCLAQNIPIPKELWDMPVVQSFVRGDVDDVIVVGPRLTEEEIQERANELTQRVAAKGFYQSQLDEPIDGAIVNTAEDQWAKVAESAKQDIAEVNGLGPAYNSAVESLRAKGIIIP